MCGPDKWLRATRRVGHSGWSPRARTTSLGFDVSAAVAILILVEMTVPMIAGATSIGISKVEMTSPDGTTESVSAPFPERITFGLGLGYNMDEQVIVLTRAAASNGEYRVQVQFESFLSVGDEGPHLDLIGWRGCKSEWRNALQISPLSFKLPLPTAADESCRPQASAREIRKEVAKRGGKRWARFVTNVRGADSEPLYAAIGSIHLAVQRRISERWETVLRIDVSVPMGC